MPTSSAIIWPAIALALLTFVVTIVMGARRRRSLAQSRQSIEDRDLAVGRSRWNDAALQASNNYENLFELPVLFYAVIAFAAITRTSDGAMLWLAWLFVASRVVHTLVHLGANRVKHRGIAWIVGSATLLAMWLLLAWRIW